jgi:GTP pyrophosphokinase
MAPSDSPSNASVPGQPPLASLDGQPARVLEVTPEQFLGHLARAHPRLNADLIRATLDFATRAHAGQKRQSGGPYIDHPVTAAAILMELGMDTVTICAALLHDVLEDCSVSCGELEDRFGATVAKLVDGVTKLSQLNFETREQAHAKSLRKMLLAMTSDVRVILVKLADRLHNVSTLEHVPAEKQKRIARETLEIYAPLAQRLGIFKLKRQMEDLCLRYSEPERYLELSRRLALTQSSRDAFVGDLIARVTEVLRQAGLDAQVTRRFRSLYSVYKKTLKHSPDLTELYDLMGLRVIARSSADCYAALGVIHKTWLPINDRFKDYIAIPKANLYRSLHTTVIDPQGHVFEVQLRTQEMDDLAERGIATHWSTKTEEERDDSRYLQENLAWLNQIAEWDQEAENSTIFVRTVKLDLLQSQVYVFTPQGRVHELPAGATTLDFAYGIHTQVGHQCVGAQVNGRSVPLSYQLKSGQIVHILTDKQSRGPSRDWLSLVKSGRAKANIRAWLKKEPRQELGTRVGDTPAVQQAAALAPSPGRSLAGGYGVAVDGQSEALVRLSKCCNPVVGDPIVGYRTRGRGVSVHRSGCPNALALAAHAERQVRVLWDLEPEVRKDVTYLVELEICARDGPNVLGNVTNCISNLKLNIHAASARVAKQNKGFLNFTVEIQETDQLERLMASISQLPEVLRVSRVLPGGRQSEAAGGGW